MTDTASHPRSHPERLRTFQKNVQHLASAQPSVVQPFWGLHKAAVSSGALDGKTKELIALAISVAVRCDDCVAHHTHDALEAGATREEIADALGVAIMMAGGPGVVYATHAIEAVDQFLEGAG